MLSNDPVFLGILYSTIIMILYIAANHMVKRNEEINNMYIALEDLASNYFKMYPITPQDYFNGIVLDKTFMMTRFWIKDLNQFIIDDDKLALLVKANKKDVQERKKVLEERRTCPWCDNESEFGFEIYNTEEKLGAFRCINCGATTPIGTEKECEELLKDN